MDLAQLALEEAALKALSDTVNDRLKEVKNAMQEQLVGNGISKVTASLPDGTKVATISRSDAKPAAVVIDDDAFLTFVRGIAPSEVTTRLVTEIRPAYRTTLLAQMTAAGVARIVDTDTGELHDVPGVEIKPTRALTHSVRTATGGKEAIAEAWRTGALAHLNLLQIEAGEAS
ncbi:hypothetical protein [Streptomyces sp. NBC_00140]|uniref:hypothetical protein n=1 Tax=Streptomyces sp. NBC_00140 TaxID=2975664 RepID=UPI0022529043|nr:hypothetical protein [Streptomyces sp. NBC_00140]MCX5336943.1 hypothetical protein [Streptomyces sp. NBC_00140]MCX5338426.1 hypothetical protein [Streptomyces sp. NBC_00140]